MKYIHVPRPCLFIFLVAAIVVTGPGFSQTTEFGFGDLSKKHPLVVDTAAREIRVFADLQPGAFSGFFKITPNYHALVWKKGKAAREALLAAYADDRAFYDAMRQLGAIPGNNLTTAAWNDRNDPHSSAPDTRIEGTPVEMLVWWPGLAAPLPIDSLLIDPGGRGIDLRFGGNLALIPEWKSGCIVCLYSCPGSKVGNHAYTIRDYARGTTHFEVNKRIVPKKKTRAMVIFRLKQDGSE